MRNFKTSESTPLLLTTGVMSVNSQDAYVDLLWLIDRTLCENEPVIES